MAAEQMSKSRKVLLSLMLLLYAAGIPALVYFSCASQNAVEDAADAYVEALRQKRFDQAYAMLAPGTRSRVPRSAFERTMATEELSRSSGHGWSRTESSSAGKGCVDGGVTIGEGTFSLTLYMWKGAEEWKVHTIFFEQVDYTNAPWRCFSG